MSHQNESRDKARENNISLADYIHECASTFQKGEQENDMIACLTCIKHDDAEPNEHGAYPLSFRLSLIGDLEIFAHALEQAMRENDMVRDHVLLAVSRINAEMFGPLVTQVLSMASAQAKADQQAKDDNIDPAHN